MILETEFNMTETGLKYNSIFISKFRLMPVQKIQVKSFDGTCIRKEYKVKAVFADGQETEIITVADYKNVLSSNEWNECMEVYYEQDAKKYLLADFQIRLNKLVWSEQIILQHMGLYRLKPLLYVYSGDRVIKSERDITNYNVNPNVPVMKIKDVSRNEVDEYLFELVQFLPGVTDVIFGYRLVSVLKPLFLKAKKKLDTILDLIGKSRNMKTTYAELFLTKSDGNYQKFLTAKAKAVESMLYRFEGSCILLDDYKEAHQSYIKQRMKDVFEILVRMEDFENTAMVITTSEFVEGDYSFQDRLIQIYVDKTLAEYSEEELIILRKLQEHKEILDYFWYDFTKKVYANADEIVNMISMCNDIDEYITGFRIDRNIAILKLAYEVFYKLNMDSKICQYKKQTFEALDKVRLRQAEHMNKMKIFCSKDWVELIRQIINQDYFRIELRDSLNAQVFVKERILYVIPSILEDAVRQFLQIEISSQIIAKELNLKQILKKDASRDLTVKVNGKRYYGIFLDRLRK